MDRAQESLDRNGSTTPTGPEPTAFIIALDFDDSSPKKKMNIKDSIRQFAPPKPDSIEKQRPVRSAPSDSNHTNSDGNSRSGAKDIFGRRRGSANECKNQKLLNRVMDSGGGGDRGGHLSDSATYLINRMLSYATAKDKTNGRQVRANGVADAKSRPQEVEWRGGRGGGGEKDSGVSDDNKSETGTYTVAVDDDNAELETARKQIDTIFGVSDDNMTVSLNSSLASSLNSPTLLMNIEDSVAKARQSRDGSAGKGVAAKAPVASDRQRVVTRDYDELSQSLANRDHNSTFTRTKRRPPTVEEMLHQNVDHFRDNKPVNERKDCSLLSSSAANNALNNKSVVSYSQHQRNDLSKVSNNNNRNTANNSSNKAPAVSVSAPSTPRSPFMSRKVFELKSKAAPKGQPLDSSRRKNSWSHYSDADTYESYQSDDSTHSSHRSYNSGNGSTSCGSSVPSKMRFNRAFALRRARLGIDTPGVELNVNKSGPKSSGMSSTTSSAGRQATPQKPANSSAANGFSRSDGGRFSLRVSNTATNNLRKNVPQMNRMSTSRENVSHTNGVLQRKGSDPTGAQSVINPWKSRSAASDTDRRSMNSNANRVNNWSTSLRQDIHRHYLQKSPSFADRNKTAGAVSVTRDPPIGLPTPPPARRVAPVRSVPQVGYQSESAIPSSPQPSPSPQRKPPVSQQKAAKPGLELSALDGLVVSAIHQLSQKLRSNMRSVLESQRPKHEANSDTAFMIDELLPQLSSPDRRSATESGVSVSRDLSAVLKNLKKLEHSFDVLNLALDPNAAPPRRQSNAFFVVDV